MAIPKSYATTLPRCVVALDSCDQGRSVAMVAPGVQATFTSPTTALTDLVSDLLDDQRLTWSDVDGWVVVHGPGGLTGVRVAVATAQALGYATERPVVGVSSLDTLRAGVCPTLPTHPSTVLVAQDARMGQVFWSWSLAVPGKGWTTLVDDRLDAVDALWPRMETCLMSSDPLVVEAASRPCTLVGSGAAQVLAAQTFPFPVACVERCVQAIDALSLPTAEAWVEAKTRLADRSWLQPHYVRPLSTIVRSSQRGSTACPAACT